MLAFAFIATVGVNGMVNNMLADWFGLVTSGSYLYTLSGLILVYSYFQVPLMVIVFLPAVDGIRSQWREAAETLGGSTWVYWRRVAGPLLAPAFLGSTLLLFANAFSAYATAKALISQSNPIVPLQIAGAITNEVNVGHADLAKSLALGMVVIVAVVMWLYALLQRRTARWLG
jgi:putative spermidine/putrescine transport system permease protein